MWKIHLCIFSFHFLVINSSQNRSYKMILLFKLLDDSLSLLIFLNSSRLDFFALHEILRKSQRKTSGHERLMLIFQKQTHRKENAWEAEFRVSRVIIAFISCLYFIVPCSKLDFFSTKTSSYDILSRFNAIVRLSGEGIEKQYTIK